MVAVVVVVVVVVWGGGVWWVGCGWMTYHMISYITEIIPGSNKVLKLWKSYAKSKKRNQPDTKC